ncbi:Arylacetamide deacetylase-like 2 [Apodemus speciosus]|uniref:Arylacetamide deacetylase-like 2 n=1 Tax=Apodemus speciosus TaxID=105296 RepID=A0ABQ0EKD3_APOSI
MTLAAIAKTCNIMAEFLEIMGVMRYEEFASMIISLDYTQPYSDEHITVTDTTFVDIPVRLYLPKRKSEAPRRAVIYFHGGGFCFGSCKQRAFDFLNRWTANKLDAVVVGVELEDGLTAVKFFLQDKILTKYGVDPTRIAVSGDSSGGTLTAAVAQQMNESMKQGGTYEKHPSCVHTDPEIKHKFKLQVLLYPALQVVDTQLPSHLENEHGIILTRDIAIRLVSMFYTEDDALRQAMRKNQHMPLESRHLLKFVNWSTLLPEKFRKDRVYTEPVLGRSAFSLPALMDHRALPLIANDTHLQHLPRTYILTCQYDVLRDDGIMYASRLQNVGVQVVHDHVDDGIHGALSYMTSPFHLQLGLRIRDMYVSWLDKNL